MSEPSRVRGRPAVLRETDLLERVIPVRRIGARVDLAVERDPERLEDALVTAIRRLGGVDQGAIPVEHRRAKRRRGTGRYQSSRTPNCIWRGSPAPLCTVPSKLKMRLVTSGRCRFLLLKRLKTSSAGSTVTPRLVKRCERRRSSEEYWLAFRPRFRCVTTPSTVQEPSAFRFEQRSCGVNASAPLAVIDFGCADRYE